VRAESIKKPAGGSKISRWNGDTAIGAMECKTDEWEKSNLAGIREE
jgi:hypothetical protein